MSDVINILTELDASSLLTPVPSSIPSDTFDITVHDTSFNRVITYTTNGMEPTLNSQKYTQPITIERDINNPITLKILFYDHMSKECDYYSGEYVFTPEILSDALCGLQSRLSSPLEITIDTPTSAYTGLTTINVATSQFITSNLTSPIIVTSIKDIVSYIGETVTYIDADMACHIESLLTEFEIPQLPFDTWVSEDGMFVIVDEASTVDVGDGQVEDGLRDLIFEGIV
jgi:hypothetical protein